MVKKSKIVEEVAVSTVKTSDLCTNEPIIKKKYIKPFIHDMLAINFMTLKYKDVCMRKKVQHYLKQGVPLDQIEMPFNTTVEQCQTYSRIEAKRFKLSIGVKFQSEPVILVSNKFLERCTVCTEKAPLIAIFEWLDEFTDRETHERIKQPVSFTLCEACLRESGAIYLTKAQWLGIVLAAAKTDNVRYDEMHNAKSLPCALCSKHATDSTYVYVHYEDLWFNVPVCDEHFDLMVVPPVAIVQEGLGLAKDMKLSPHLQALLAVYQREKPVKMTFAQKIDDVIKEQRIADSYKFKDEVTE